MNAIISVLYDEPDPTTYRGVAVRVGDAEDVILSSDDPTVDYVAAGWVALRAGCTSLICSSSVSHFAMDGGDLNTTSPTPAQMEAGLHLASNISR